MTTKNLVILAAAAAALGAAAYFTRGGERTKTQKLNGAKIVGDFDLSAAASLEVGDKVKLVAGDDGWTVATMQDYPADRGKITEALLKLSELKVGQVARGKKIAEPLKVAVKDAAGKELASVTLGERHEKWGMGRYAEYKGESVLVADSLTEFGDDSKRWCETKIVDEPYVSFKELAPADVSDELTGLSTGVVATVTIAGDTNRTVTVGNKVEGGSDRYLKLDQGKWVFVVPSYSVEKLLPKPPEPEKSEKTDAVAEESAKSDS